jgi:hypothetical protein
MTTQTLSRARTLRLKTGHQITLDPRTSPRNGDCILISRNNRRELAVYIDGQAVAASQSLSQGEYTLLGVVRLQP